MSIITNVDAVRALVGGGVSQNAGGIHYHDGQTPPSESAINAKRVELQAAYPLQELREKRNVLLAASDWMANKDVTLPAAWKTYRQELRDLPSGLDTVEKVNAVTWPTKPS